MGVFGPGSGDIPNPRDEFGSEEEEIEVNGGEAWFLEGEGREEEEVSESVVSTQAWTSSVGTERVAVEDVMKIMRKGKLGAREGDPGAIMGGLDEVMENGGDPWFMDESGE